MRRDMDRMHVGMESLQSLDYGLIGDFEDPRKRGILRNTSCHAFRQQLRSSHRSNMVQGLLLVTAIATLLVVLWFHTLESTTTTSTTTTTTTTTRDQNAEGTALIGMLEAFWLCVANFLGIASGDHNANPTISSLQSHHCNQRMNTQRIFRQIGKQVLNQEPALARLERAVQSTRPLRSVALLGPPGVGKTLTAMALQQHFPWPENVHSYSWSTYVPDEAHRFQVLRNFVTGLSNCGQNLLIIDNLSTCDYTVVSVYNKLLEECWLADRHAAANQTVLVIYIFSLELEYYWEQFELLQQLPADTTIINYRRFGRDELLACLENELRLEQRHLDGRTFAKILDTALNDIDNAGCKRIRSLMFQYGQRPVN